MTRKLEDLFDLPPNDTPEPESAPSIEETRTYIAEIDDTIDKIDAALPGVRDLSASDTEMDDLAAKATKSFDDLMDLGMNVEARYSGRIFEVAGGMLKNAIDAKAAKIDKKLKMIDLQLKKQKLDNDSLQEDNSVSIQGDGVIITDRNSLLEKLRNMK